MALLLPGEVWAHHFMEDQLPQTFVQGLLSGLAHPVIGLDHLAFIIATGFLLALVRHGVWGVIALTLGSLLGAFNYVADVVINASGRIVAFTVVNTIGSGLVLVATALGAVFTPPGSTLTGLGLGWLVGQGCYSLLAAAALAMTPTSPPAADRSSVDPPVAPLAPERPA